jgi:hypothetical protein
MSDNLGFVHKVGLEAGFPEFFYVIETNCDSQTLHNIRRCNSLNTEGVIKLSSQQNISQPALHLRWFSFRDYKV